MIILEDIFQYALFGADGVLTLALSYAGWKLKQYRKAEEEREKRELARDTLQLATARAILIRECNHYIRKGYAPLYALDSITDMFNAYHALGGNGAVKEIYEEFRKLPHVEKLEGLI